MKMIIYFLEYLLIKFFFIFLKILPFKLSKTLSSFTVRFLGKLSSAHKTAIDNCKFVFPNLSQDKINKIIDKSWNNIGETISELIRLREFIESKNITIKGIHNVENIKNNNSQAIFISIHQSNWEVLAPTLDRQGLNLGAIYRHINNKYLDQMILNIRNNSLIFNSSFYTPKGRKSAKDLIDAIKNNFSILLLIDQKDSAGENILFFNKYVKTQIAFLKLARKFNLPIIPIKNTRLDNGKIELEFMDPIFHNNKMDDNKMMKEIHLIIEKWIITNPNQWFWQHKRFS